jgi:hypothetical protein
MQRNVHTTQIGKTKTTTKIVSFKDLTLDEFLTLCKSEGLDDEPGTLGKAYWNGIDYGTVTVKQVRAVHAFWKRQGYRAVDVSNPNWIDFV